jgi:hypothetical protein
MSAEPGRNDSCPCGSGRKYKQCCLEKKDLERDTVRSLHQVQRDLMPELVEFTFEADGHRGVEQAWQQFFAPRIAPPLVGEPHPDFEALFLPWLIFRHAEPRRRRLWRQRQEVVPPSALRFLAARERELSSDEIAFIVAGCGTPFSFHAVTAIEPGVAFSVRDVLFGDEQRVVDRAGSQSVHAGGLIYGQIATLKGVGFAFSLASILLPPIWQTEVVRLRRSFTRRDRLSTTHHELADPVARSLYLEIADRLRNPVPPKLTNTDGDPIEFTEIRYALTCAPRMAFDLLKDLALDAPDEDLLDGATFGDDGSLQRVQFSWTKRGNRLHKEWDNTILGQLTIEPGRLAVEVNSSRRAAKIRREVERRLGLAASFAGASVTDHPSLTPVSGAGTVAIDPATAATLPLSPAHPEAMAALMERHWEAWFDQRIPALGNKTPRQAARTKPGRELLEALLADYGWKNDRMPTNQRVDIAALRRELGLE